MGGFVFGIGSKGGWPQVLVGVFFALVAVLPFIGGEASACFVIAGLGIILLSLFVRALSPEDEFRFLLAFCICSFLLRGSLAIIVHPFDSFFAPDTGAYDSRAYSLAQGGQPSLGKAAGYIYFVAGIYRVFGHTPVGAMIANGFLGTLTTVFVYLIARDIYSRKVARTAFLLTAFFPSLILWSALLLKDTLSVFLIVLIIWSTIKLHRQFRIRYVIMILVSTAYLTQIRYYIVPFVVAAVLSSFLIQPIRRLGRSMLVGVTVAMLFFAIWQYAPGETKGRYSGYSVDLASVNDIRAGFAGGGSEFLGDIRIGSYVEAIKFLPVGLLYFFLGPFPWQIKIHRPLQVIALPEVLMWYCLVPFMVYGLGYILRHRIRSSYPIIVYVMLLTLAYSFTITNMGSLYRFRAQMLVFYFIFVAVGITRFRDRRSRFAGRS